MLKSLHPAVPQTIYELAQILSEYLSLHWATKLHISHRGCSNSTVRATINHWWVPFLLYLMFQIIEKYASQTYCLQIFFFNLNVLDFFWLDFLWHKFYHSGLLSSPRIWMFVCWSVVLWFFVVVSFKSFVQKGTFTKLERDKPPKRGLCTT